MSDYSAIRPGASDIPYPMAQWHSGAATTVNSVYSGWGIQTGQANGRDLDEILAAANWPRLVVRHKGDGSGPGKEQEYWVFESSETVQGRPVMRPSPVYAFVVARGLPDKRDQRSYGIAYGFNQNHWDGPNGEPGMGAVIGTKLRFFAFVADFWNAGYRKPIFFTLTKSFTKSALTVFGRDHFRVLDAIDKVRRERAAKQRAEGKPVVTPVYPPYYAAAVGMRPSPTTDIASGRGGASQITPMISTIGPAVDLKALQNYFLDDAGKHYPGLLDLIQEPNAGLEPLPDANPDDPFIVQACDWSTAETERIVSFKPQPRAAEPPPMRPAPASPPAPSSTSSSSPAPSKPGGVHSEANAGVDLFEDVPW